MSARTSEPTTPQRTRTSARFAAASLLALSMMLPLCSTESAAEVQQLIADAQVQTETIGNDLDRVHAQLYRDLMAATGLETGYLHYFDDVPPPVIAVVNMMSLFGLHRRLRAAMVGHFAAAEITTAPSAARMVKAIQRLGGGGDVTHFFAEHVEADAVHEQVLRHDVVGDLLDREPELTADVVFGVRATEFLEGRFGEHVLTAWQGGGTSLLRPLG